MCNLCMPFMQPWLETLRWMLRNLVLRGRWNRSAEPACSYGLLIRKTSKRQMLDQPCTRVKTKIIPSHSAIITAQTQLRSRTRHLSTWTNIWPSLDPATYHSLLPARDPITKHAPTPTINPKQTPPGKQTDRVRHPAPLP